MSEGVFAVGVDGWAERGGLRVAACSSLGCEVVDDPDMMRCSPVVIERSFTLNAADIRCFAGEVQCV